MLKSVVAGVALGAFGVFGTAEASIVTVSYYGQIGVDGYDANNTFGAGTDLSGQFLTLTYVFDTSKGTHTTGGGVDDVSNLGTLGQQSPSLSVSMTVNGKTLSFAGSYFGEIAASDAYGYSMLSQNAANDEQSYNSASTTLTAPLGSFPNSVTNPLSIALGGSGEPTAFGTFSFYNTDATTGYNVTGSFDARSIAISAVPLPSALPLFGLALAGLGTAAAFRKRHGRQASR